MTQFRIFTYIVPRLSQLIGWSVDTNSYVEPLIKQENIPKPTEMIRRLDKIQRSLYQPPPYLPSPLSKGRS